MIIRKREKRDCRSIAHIVTVEWNRTYKGLVSDEFLQELYENEDDRAAKSYEKFDVNDNNKLVLEVDDKVVGFANYGKSEDPDLENCGEIFALYVLDEYHGNGYGKKMVEAVKSELKKLGFDKMIIACLKGNPANDFYKHIGGVYLKEGLYERLSLPENIYYYEL